MLFFNNIKAFRLCFILDHSVFKKIRKSLKSIVVLIVENISCWTVHKACYVSYTYECDCVQY